MVFNTSPSFRFFAPAGHLHPFLDVSGLAGAFLCEVFLIVLRLCLGRSPLVRFALLPAVDFALLGSFHHCSRPSMFFSCGPRTLVALLHSFHHWLVGCGSVFDSLTTGSLAVVPSVLFLQSHCVVVYDSVVRFWLLPTPLLSIAPFVIDGLRWEVLIHGEVVYNNVFCFCEVWFERFVVPAARCSPILLCAALGCVHLHNESFHRGLLSRRGPLGRPAPQGVHRSSCFSD